jgi:hypothetical protein
MRGSQAGTVATTEAGGGGGGGEGDDDRDSDNFNGVDWQRLRDFIKLFHISAAH